SPVRIYVPTRGRPPPITSFPYTTLFRSSSPCSAHSRLSAAAGVWEMHMASARWFSFSKLSHTSGNGGTPWTMSSMAALTASDQRSEEHTSELQSRSDLVCRLLLEKHKHQ